jgi:hypothetical protein
MSTEDRKCLRCGGSMEDGFLWANNSVGEHAMSYEERCGWMAGSDWEHKKVGIWPLKVDVATNQRRTLAASRCTSCGMVELYAK